MESRLPIYIDYNKGKFTIPIGMDEESKFIFEAIAGHDMDMNPIGGIDLHRVLNPEKYRYGDVVNDDDIEGDPCGTILFGQKTTLYALKMCVDWLWDQMENEGKCKNMIDADELLRTVEESWKHAGLHWEDYKKICRWIRRGVRKAENNKGKMEAEKNE